uniref:Uncharacterized protein n=1 Tax=Rhizophora mucronata TaxID=61149 RepID=A0A2P2QKN8_RHIMU
MSAKLFIKLRLGCTENVLVIIIPVD